MSAPAHPPRPVVLVVDDEAEIRSLLQTGLAAHFEVEGAGSAEEAELMLATRQYDVIVSDHLMDGEEGLPFLGRMRERFPRVGRILLTSYINPELLARSTGLAGLSACLTKPVALAELIAAIKRALPR